VSNSLSVDAGTNAGDRQLSKSLLKRDFGLKLELPDDRLRPPVGER
jgi:23S rRNA A1618 N6-methylase RlmF